MTTTTPGAVERWMIDTGRRDMPLLEKVRQQDALVRALTEALVAVTTDMEEAIGSMPIGEMQRAVWQTGIDLSRAALQRAKEGKIARDALSGQPPAQSEREKVLRERESLRSALGDAHTELHRIQRHQGDPWECDAPGCQRRRFALAQMEVPDA